MESRTQLQNTRFTKLIDQLVIYFSTFLSGPWNRRSISLISILLGFYLGSNITVYFLQRVGQRPIVVLAMVIIIEILVRMRSYVSSKPWPLYWLIIDNLRIGSIYSVCLEAFKLGS